MFMTPCPSKCPALAVKDITKSATGLCCSESDVLRLAKATNVGFAFSFQFLFGPCRDLSLFGLDLHNIATTGCFQLLHRNRKAFEQISYLKFISVRLSLRGRVDQ